MSILSPSDFNSSTSYELANWSAQATSERIQGAINTYEPEFYKVLLGDIVYSAVTADPPTMDASILEATKEQAAMYVYWFIRTIGFSQTTETGEVQSANENSTIITPMRKMVFNWNRMVDLNLRTVANWDATKYGMYYIEFPLVRDIRYPQYRKCEIPEIFTKTNILGL